MRGSIKDSQGKEEVKSQGHINCKSKYYFRQLQKQAKATIRGPQARSTGTHPTPPPVEPQASSPEPSTLSSDLSPAELDPLYVSKTIAALLRNPSYFYQAEESYRAALYRRDLELTKGLVGNFFKTGPPPTGEWDIRNLRYIHLHQGPIAPAFLRVLLAQLEEFQQGRIVSLQGKLVAPLEGQDYKSTLLQHQYLLRLNRYLHLEGWEYLPTPAEAQERIIEIYLGIKRRLCQDCTGRAHPVYPLYCQAHFRKLLEEHRQPLHHHLLTNPQRAYLQSQILTFPSWKPWVELSLGARREMKTQAMVV